MEQSTICIFGAGSIGCYVGGKLAAAGASPVLIGRERLQRTLGEQFSLSDYKGFRQQLAPETFEFTTSASAVAGANLVLLAVKSADTRDAASALASHLPTAIPIVSLQNGVGNVHLLQQMLPRHTVLAGMVPFNVIQEPAGHFHRGTEGDLMVAADPLLAQFQDLFRRAGLPLVLRHDMEAVLWGKLLLNLNNPVNALSDIPLKAELSQRDYRRCLALAQQEALILLSAAGIKPARVTALAPPWLPRVLRLPNPLFTRLAARMLAIDPLARSSMWEDLNRRRKTEVDYINGAVVALAERLGRDAPVNRALVELIHQCENGNRQSWDAASLHGHLASLEQAGNRSS